MVPNMDAIETIERKFQALAPHFDEAALRTWAALEARGLGRGGVQAVARVTGMSRTTIYAGLAELKAGAPAPAKPGERSRVRSIGGGRKKLTDKNPGLWSALDALIEPLASQPSAAPLRWTSKSTSRLTDELSQQGHQISQRTVCNLLSEMGYSLQLTRNSQIDIEDPGWNAQFERIAMTVAHFLSADAPVVLVEALKLKPEDDDVESGEVTAPQSQPERPATPLELAAAIDADNRAARPSAHAEAAAEPGRISPSNTLDSATFATETMRRWWLEMGKPRFPHAQHLLVIIDHLTRNPHRQATWNRSLQQLSDELQLSITACYLPPCTRKWAHSTRQMVSQVTLHRHAQPPLQRTIAINLIALPPRDTPTPDKNIYTPESGSTANRLVA